MWQRKNTENISDKAKNPGECGTTVGRCLDFLLFCFRFQRGTLPALFPVLYTFCQQIFNLTVDGAEIIFRPLGECGCPKNGVS